MNAKMFFYKRIKLTFFSLLKTLKSAYLCFPISILQITKIIIKNTA
jgi:hypothetical protein